MPTEQEAAHDNTPRHRPRLGRHPAGRSRLPINPLCLQHLVEMARERGVRGMLEQVHEDAGLTYFPNAKWWFCKAMLISGEREDR